MLAYLDGLWMGWKVGWFSDLADTPGEWGRGFRDGAAAWIRWEDSLKGEP